MPLHPVPARILSSAQDVAGSLPPRVQWASLAAGYVLVIGAYLAALLGMTDGHTAPVAARALLVLLVLSAIVVLGIVFGRLHRARRAIVGRHRAGAAS